MSCFAILPHFVPLHGVVTIWCNISATHHTTAKIVLFLLYWLLLVAMMVFLVCNVLKYTIAWRSIQVDFLKQSVSSDDARVVWWRVMMSFLNR